MSEPVENARRWSGFVCPDCRFVFRLPRDHDGRGVVCPSCRRMLRIPGPGDRAAPLLAEGPRVAAPAGAEGVVKRRRSERAEHRGETDWGKGGVGERGGGRMGWILLGGAAGLGVLVCLLALVSQHGGKPLPAGPMQVPVAVAMGPDTDASVTASPGYSAMSDIEFAEQVQPLAKRFLEARTIAELLPLVREPERAALRMKVHYPDGTVPARGLVEFDALNEVIHRGKVHTTVVRTRDFEELAISFVETEQGLKVDWEAWEGWSEMPWADFKKTRPSEPKVFRVALKRMDYYNRGFADDLKWKSFSLESPDGLESLYGYAEQGSDLAASLTPPSDAQSVPFVLRLRFPEAASSGDQVVIEEILAEGWVVESEGPP